MAGARGPLRLVDATTVEKVADGSAAADVPAVAPLKPATVAANLDLSAAWDEIVPQLDKAGLVSPADGPVIELALMAFVASRKAYGELLTASSVALRDAKNARQMKHPSDAVARAQGALFLECAKQLGMTFVSRARTPSSKGAADGEANPFGPRSS